MLVLEVAALAVRIRTALNDQRQDGARVVRCRKVPGGFSN